MPRALRAYAVLASALLLAGCGGGAGPQADRGAPLSQAVPGPSTESSTAPSPGTSTPGGPASGDDANGELVPTNLPSSLPTQGGGSSHPPAQVFGADISWPQCPRGMGIPEKRSTGAPLPTAAARFVVIGLTNGPSFVTNPCLAAQLRWAQQRHLRVSAYSVLSYPDARTLRRYGRSGPFAGTGKLDALSNVGFRAARFNVAAMRAAGLRTPFVWIDVEPVPGFEWSRDLTANAAVVLGMERGYERAGFGTGFYSTPSLWQRVVGNLRVGSAEWRAAGETSRREALRRCAEDWSIQGGPAILGQWVEDGRDRDITCPGVSASLGRWFHQY